MIIEVRRRLECVNCRLILSKLINKIKKTKNGSYFSQCILCVFISHTIYKYKNSYHSFKTNLGIKLESKRMEKKFFLALKWLIRAWYKTNFAINESWQLRRTPIWYYFIYRNQSRTFLYIFPSTLHILFSPNFFVVLELLFNDRLD